MSYIAQSGYLIHAIELPVEEVHEAIESFRNIWRRMNSTNGELILYHYTTIEGLKGILNDRSIRCSHITVLKDSSELEYGKEIIINILNRYLELEKESTVNNFLKTLAMLIEAFVTNLYRVYIACFCEADELPNLWEEYANNGKGFNLKILFNSDTGYSHDITNIPSNSKPLLRKAIYDPKIQNDIVENYISLLVTSIKEALIKRKYFPPAWDYISAVDLVNILYEIMISLKKQKYKKEQEWRLIQALDKKPQQYINTYIYNNISGVLEIPILSIKSGPMLD
jgi:hypothetical protein